MGIKHSLSQRYQASLVLLAVVPALVLGYLWIADEYARFERDSQLWLDTHIDTRKLFLQREVYHLRDAIASRQAGIEQRLRDELQRRVAGAREMLESAVDGAGNREQTLNRATSLVTAVRMPGGVSLQLIDLDTEQLLTAAAVSSSDTLWLDRVLESTQAGGGKFIDSWRPWEPLGAGLHRVVSYVEVLPGLRLGVLASGFPQEVLAQTQREIIDQLSGESARAGSVALFINTYDGVQLVNPFDADNNGQFLGRETDALGNPVLPPQLVAAEKSGGDFVEFYELSGEGSTPARSISFVTGFNDWRWIIGATFRTAQLNTEVDRQRQLLAQRVKRHTGSILLIVAALVLLALLVAHRLAAHSRIGFQRFQRLFAAAGQESTMIDPARLPYREFEAIARDANQMIVERSRYEAELRLSEQRFRMALDASLNYLWDVDLTRGTIRLSDAFVKKLGLEGKARTYPLDAIRDRCHPQDIVEWNRAVLRLRNNELGEGLEVRLRSADDQYRWYYCRGGVVEWDAAGGALRALGTVTDVGVRKEMERELVGARQTAEEASRAKSRFLSNISHELRTPLNGILGHSQLLLRADTLPAEQREQVLAIEHSGRRLLALIDEVLDFARTDAGDLRLNLQPASLRELAEAEVRDAAAEAMPRGLQVTLALDETVPAQIKLDVDKLGYVLRSILLRLVSDTAEGSIELAISVQPEGRALDFVLGAASLVMDAQAQRDIYEAFSSHGTGAMGLGLAISVRLVKAMGGDLQLQVSAAHGTRFQFTLPLIAASVTAAAGSADGPVTHAPASAAAASVVPLPGAMSEALQDALASGDVERLQRLVRRLEREPQCCPELALQLAQRLARFDLEGFRQLLASSQATA